METPRQVTPAAAKSSLPYKAIVFINLSGGLDSYNILTPYDDPSCYLYEDYYQNRGGRQGVGLKLDEMHPIDGSSAGIDGCNTFGVHRRMGAYKDIFDEGKGIFIASMGYVSYYLMLYE